jgi:hypothetical protein
MFGIKTLVRTGLVLLLFPFAAQAQSDFARAHGKFLVGATQPVPTFKLDSSYQPKVGIKDTDVKSDLVKVKARLGKFYALSENVVIGTGFNFGLRNYSFDGIGSLGMDLDEDLYEIAVDLGVNWFINENLLLSVVFRPGIFSDLDSSLESDDWQFQGTAVGTYRVNRNWFIKLGLRVGEDFDQTSVIPVGGFTWIASDQLRVDVLLPRAATLTWQPWENRSFLIVPGLHLEGQQYHVETAAGDGDIQIQDIRFDVTGSYEVSEGARVSLSIGSNFRGKYDVEGDAGFFKADADQDPSVYVAIGFGASF